MRIGLLGMYASANLGDTAIQSVVIGALRSRRSDVDFVGLSHDPEDVVATHGIAGFPASGEGSRVLPKWGPETNGKKGATPDRIVKRLGFFGRLLALRNINREARDLDMLIVSGGGQIDDFWGGPWQQPFRLLVWSAFAGYRGKPVAVFAVGVDDLHSRLSVWFVTRALHLAKYRTFRDRGSLEILRKRGLKVTADVCPDPAFAYPVRSTATGRKEPEVIKFAVISPISVRAFPGTTRAEYDSYLNALAYAADSIRQQGLEIRFVCSQIKMDPQVVSRVTLRMKIKSGVSVADVKCVDDFIESVTDAQVVVASRLHAIILALVAGVPVIAVSPARKVRQQMTDTGLDDYCVDLKSLDGAVLLSRVQQALTRRLELLELISTRVSEFRARVEGGLDQLAALVPSAIGD